MIATARSANLPVAGAVDMARYCGYWFEIAGLPNRFQKPCTGESMVEYSISERSKIEVAYHCASAAGVCLTIGAMKRVDGSGNAKWKISFAPVWLRWLPMVWRDYWIIALDENYAFAMVGTPDRNDLWILSHLSTLPEAVYGRLVSQAAQQGFDVARLVKRCNEQDTNPDLDPDPDRRRTDNHNK